MSLKQRRFSDLIEYRLKYSKIIKQISERPFESNKGKNFLLKVFENTLSNEKHYALVKNIKSSENLYPVRMHKLNIEKDIFVEKDNFGDEINHSFDAIEKNGSGAIVIINNNIAPNILKAFDQRQKQNNKLELREYGVGAQILKNIGIEKINITDDGWFISGSFCGDAKYNFGHITRPETIKFPTKSVTCKWDWCPCGSDICTTKSKKRIRWIRNE